MEINFHENFWKILSKSILIIANGKITNKRKHYSRKFEQCFIHFFHFYNEVERDNRIKNDLQMK